MGRMPARAQTRRASSCGGHAPRTRRRGWKVTALPRDDVSVPVLSNTMVSTCARRSRTRAFFRKILQPRQQPLRRAQRERRGQRQRAGQATISTEVNALTRPGGLAGNHPEHRRAAARRRSRAG